MDTPDPYKAVKPFISGLLSADESREFRTFYAITGRKSPIQRREALKQMGFLPLNGSGF